VRLLRNDGGNASRWVRVRLMGSTVNRDGIGTTVQLSTRDGSRHVRVVKTGSSYLSQSELPVTFGLGTNGEPADLTITWPNGTREVVSSPGVNRTIIVQQGKGLVSR
jgi:hypothetical protein